MSRKDWSEGIQLDNSDSGPLRIPAFGWTYNIELKEYERFAHGANDFKQRPRLLAREVAMLGAMNSLTDKPNWHVKIFDDEIVAKWRKEALGMPLMNEKAWDWCLTELRDEAKDFETTGRTLVLDTASRVSKSDTLVDEALRARLISATGPFRNVPDAQKDWHPNSNEQVLNLVHPSLYPLVHGKTQVLSQGGHVSLENIDSYQGVQIYSEIPDGDRTKWSHRFQWLPCEVRFEEASAKDVHITSYISNLHPRHKELYSTIEKIISLSIEP